MELPVSLVMADLQSLAEAIRTRAVSCVEVMSAYLDQIEEFNPKINAIVALQPRDVLLREAGGRDAEIARGQYRGWMHGLPWAVKDLAVTKGIRTTFGSPLFKDYIPTEDGLMVSRLRKAGVVIVGKTNVPEFGCGSQTYNTVYGVTGNAYDPTKTAGGSSGGAASAIALRMLPAADGSDMAGSLRNPAAFNNIYGLRPSFGRVPLGPTDDVFLQNLVYEGPLGRTPRDVAMLLSAQAGYDPRSPLSITQDMASFTAPLDRDFKGARLGWVGDCSGELPIEPEVLEVCRSALASFEAIGCIVEDIPLGFSTERLWKSWLALRSVWAAGHLIDTYKDPAQRPLIKPEIQWEIETALGVSGIDVYNAGVVRSEFYLHVLKLFETYDYLLAPTAQVFPFDKTTHWPTEICGRKTDAYTRWMETAIIWSLAGGPAISVPAGFGKSGLPMGLQIIGRNHAEFAVFQLAHAYHEATRWSEEVLPPLLREV
ncbi:amidase [Aquabacter sp. CN5-332]|uniref:amidase n=1 Tax=Aquabacter sp. CN5-332 TaxID=3156608 RepID=UPI0032B5556A